MEKLMIIFILLQPLLDISYTLNFLNINLIVRGIFLVLITLYLIKEKKDKPLELLYIPLIIFMFVYY